MQLTDTTPPRDRDAPTARRVVLSSGLGILAFAGLFALLWFRVDGITRGTLWAEDGPLFLGEAAQGVSVFDPYAGYIHLVPRLVAAVVVGVLPVSGWAMGMTVMSMAIVAGIAVLVYAVTGSLGLTPVGRIGLALATVFVPSLAAEILGDAANLHWLFLWLAPFLFLHRPRTRVSMALFAAVAFALAATETQTALFAPLLLLHLRDRRRWPMIAGAAAGWVIQAIALVLVPRPSTPYGAADPLSVAHGYALFAGGSGWVTPLKPLVAAMNDAGWVLAYATLLPAIVGGILLIVFSKRLRVITIALLVGSVATWVAAWVANIGDWPRYDFASIPVEELTRVATLRYSLVPSLFLLAVCVLAVDRGVAVALRSRGRVAIAALLGAVLLGSALVGAGVVNYDQAEHTTRTDGPTWRDSLDDARAQCATLAADAVVAVPIAPETWNIGLTCEQVQTDRP